MALPFERCIDLAVAEIRRMADVCAAADPATAVPTCPGWDLQELERHTGLVHRWAATMVERSSQERLKREQMDLGDPEDPAALPRWLADGAEFVATRFRAADPTTPMWAWGWPKTAGFWPRRMVHETGIHRADAEVALGLAPAYDPEVAADGIDELLDNLPHAVYFAPKVAELRGDGEVLGFDAVDTGDAWRITFGPDGFAWARGDGAATATLAATAGDLLLTLYGRRPPGDGEIDGDRALLDRWLANSSL